MHAHTDDTLSVRSTGAAAAAGLTRTLPLLVAWFLLALWLGLRGSLGSGGPPFGLGLAIALPLVVFAIDRRVGVFEGLRQLEPSTAIALQTFRVGGVFFVVAWAAGTLPGAFALPAGLGDIAIGATAPFVAAAVAKRRRGHRVLAYAWNLAGILDLVSAVSLGVTHARSPLGVFAGPVSTDALARYPFSLIPSFFVPLAIMLHVTALRGLRAGRENPASST